MYSDKANVNILTSLLVAHKVSHAVACPGSRNAPLTHNLCECPDIDCLPVTDERSAGFVALGMAQALREPVAVCVTSGSALLNTLPAVAEAFYRHVPLVIISADRPAAMIDQLQGQTLPQAGALGKFVRKAVALPEPHNDTELWYCNRLVNEALLAARQHGGGPVHINVPITEPLFHFTCPALPAGRAVNYVKPGNDCAAIDEIAGEFAKEPRAMLLIGQRTGSYDDGVLDEMCSIHTSGVVVLDEPLSNDIGGQCHFDEALSIIGDNPDYRPDFIIYIGSTFVSKRIKRFLQSFTPRRTVIVNETGELTDVTMHATDIVECRPGCMICALDKKIRGGLLSKREKTDFFLRWQAVLSHCCKQCNAFEPAYSQMLAVKQLHDAVCAQKCYLQYANSSAVRLGIMYSTQYIYVNRGVNGIEGSLSTAVGFASAVQAPVYCVIGDLSFFYDRNALWNNLRKDNLRILLLNNGGGGIFHQLPGIQASPYRDGFIAASHATSAKGICEEAGVEYRQAKDAAALREGIDWLTDDSSPKAPLLLEVFTNAETDASEMRRYAETIRQTAL